MQRRRRHFLDRERGLGLTLHVGEVGLDTHPAHDELWRGDVEVHARAMFELCFIDMPREGARPETPRSADAGWSTVIATGRIRLGAVWRVEALRWSRGC